MSNPLVSEAIANIRIRIRDRTAIGYVNDELITYINDAINQLSLYLISICDPEMVVQKELTDGDDVPDDYCKLAGEYGVFIDNGVFRTQDTELTIRYYAAKDNISVETDELPFKRLYLGVLSQMAAIYALNRNEFDITQDQKLLDGILQLIGAGKDEVSSKT